MMLKKYELRAFVPLKDYQRIEREASSRQSTMAKTVRDCLNEYLNLREELATAMTEPGQAGEAHTGKIIHTLLARTEERIAATIERLEARISQLHDQNMVLTAMLDRAYLGMMLHLPEVPAELAEGAVASANRRHAKWIKTIEKMLAEEGAQDYKQEKN
jgi:bacterioferritin (cytochrome b1)